MSTELVIQIISISDLALSIGFIYLIYTSNKSKFVNLVCWLGNTYLVAMLQPYIAIFLSISREQAGIVLASLYLLSYLFLFKGEIRKKVFTYYFMASITFLLILISNYLSAYLDPIFGVSNSNIFEVLLYFVLFFLFLLYFFLKLRRDYLGKLEKFKKNLWFINVFTICGYFALVLSFDPWAEKATPSIGQVSSMIAMALFFIFCYYFLLEFLNTYDKNIRLEICVDVANHQMNQVNRYYKGLSEDINHLKRLRHDLKHHIIVQRAMLNTGEYERLRVYLNNLEKSYLEKETPLFCKNSTVNAVLGYYYEMAKEKGIATELILPIPENIKIEAVDLCVIFSNLLLNAIEATEKLDIKKRSIYATAKIDHNVLIITIKNTFNGILSIKGAEFYSIKSEEGHGYGIESVKNCVEKYHGYIKFENKNNVFIATLIIHL